MQIRTDTKQCGVVSMMKVLKVLLLIYMSFMGIQGVSFGYEAELLDGQSVSEIGIPGEFPAKTMTSAMLSNSFPKTKLSKKSFEWNISVKYLETEVDRENARYTQKGSGISTSLSYGLSPKFGINFMAGTASGDKTEMNEIHIFYNTGYDASFERKNDEGNLAAVNLIWDPYGKSINFNLPIYLGLSYTHHTGGYEARFKFDGTYNENRIGHDGKEEASIEAKGLGFFFGIGCRFETKQFIFMPFAYAASPFESAEITWTSEDITTGEKVTSKVNSDNRGTFDLGLTMALKSINLSFTISSPIGLSSTNTTAYSIGLYFPW